MGVGGRRQRKQAACGIIVVTEFIVSQITKNSQGLKCHWYEIDPKYEWDGEIVFAILSKGCSTRFSRSCMIVFQTKHHFSYPSSSLIAFEIYFRFRTWITKATVWGFGPNIYYVFYSLVKLCTMWNVGCRKHVKAKILRPSPSPSPQVKNNNRSLIARIFL